MKFCLQCNKEILNVVKKFCNRSCAASYNNKRKPSRIKDDQYFNCLNCNNTFTRRPSQIVKGHNRFCSVKCTHDHRINNNKDEREKLFKSGKLSYRAHLRKLIIARDGYCCSNCKLTTWLNKQIPLWLDHIDGNASNNMPLNLRLICLNCDAIGETFQNKNRGKGRRSLGLKPWA